MVWVRMGGRMRSLCVVIVLSSVWQACIAEELVNLVEPHLSKTAPLAWPYFTEKWKMFDHDKATYQTVRKRQEMTLHTQDGFEISPTHYRITMAAHVPSKNYPSSWTVKGTSSAQYEYEMVLDEVTGGKFRNGVYEGELRKLLHVEEFIFKFDNKATIAEIELLGPRSALDDLWPYGEYPCIQRLAAITTKKGPENIFVRPKSAIMQSYQYDKKLRTVFDATEFWGSVAGFSLDGDKPVFVGAKLQGLPMVREVAFDNIGSPRLFESGIKRVILQGTFCEPKCHKGGSKGWARLGKVSPAKYEGRNGRILVENPGEYKAYRLKFVPRRPLPPKKEGFFELSGITFLGCTA